MSESLPVYVLVGGRSERFGATKATHPVDGQPWARHVAARLANDLSRVAIVGKSAPSGLMDLRFVADAPQAKGPLAGAMAAVSDRLQSAGPGLLVIASCDLVRPEVAWLAPLRAAHDARDDLEAAAYLIDGLWQPFPMVVHTRWQQRLSSHLASGGRQSFQSVLKASVVEAVPWRNTALAELPQANTPEELEELLKS